jgi:hypothetical protein
MPSTTSVSTIAMREQKQASERRHRIERHHCSAYRRSEATAFNQATVQQRTHSAIERQASRIILRSFSDQELERIYYDYHINFFCVLIDTTRKKNY